MIIKTTSFSVVHFTFADVVVDDFWHLKNHMHVMSPFRNARMDYWLAIEEIFDYLPPSDLTYWKHPPTLELPEHAQSLLNMEHCSLCGFPVYYPLCKAWESVF